MKRAKLILLVVLLTVTLTGCTAVRIDTEDTDNIINVVLLKDKDLFNRVGKGYKYYIPRGVTYIDTNDLNEKLYSNGIYYYLYIDIVSYFYKIDVEYEENSDLYYSKKIDGDINGYLEIVQEEDLYHIIFYYNYSKVETVVKESQINEVILNASYILSTVQFNDSIIDSMSKSTYTNIEEQYTKFKNTGTEDYFLEY